MVSPSGPRTSTRDLRHERAFFGYLSCVSTFLGFFAWYRGLVVVLCARKAVRTRLSSRST